MGGPPVGSQLIKQLNSIAHRESAHMVTVNVEDSVSDIFLGIFQHLLQPMIEVSRDVSTDEGELIKQLVKCEKSGKESRVFVCSRPGRAI